MSDMIQIMLRELQNKIKSYTHNWACQTSWQGCSPVKHGASLSLCVHGGFRWTCSFKMNLKLKWRKKKSHTAKVKHSFLLRVPGKRSFTYLIPHSLKLLLQCDRSPEAPSFSTLLLAVWTVLKNKKPKFPAHLPASLQQTKLQIGWANGVPVQGDFFFPFPWSSALR